MKTISRPASPKELQTQLEELAVAADDGRYTMLASIIRFAAECAGAEASNAPPPPRPPLNTTRRFNVVSGGLTKE